MTKKNPFAESLAKIRASTAQWFDRENDRLIRGLIESGAAKNALKQGDRVPDFMIPNAEGRLIRSADLFGRGPVIIDFYRGAWCPYCSVELNALADLSPQLQRLGASIVAITPETGGAALKIKREREFDFEILCDVDNGTAMAFGLVYHIPKDIQESYLKYNVRLPVIYGDDSWMLPIPATYVIDKDSRVAHAYVNPDFRERCDPQSLLAVIRGLR